MHSPVLSYSKPLENLDLDDNRFGHKVIHERNRVYIFILDKKTNDRYSLSISEESSQEVIRNTIQNYIITSIIEVENEKLKENIVECNAFASDDLEELFEIDPDLLCEKECPPAPLKKRFKFEPSAITSGVIVSNHQRQAEFKLKMFPKCKVMLKNGNACSAEAKKYGRCQYHLQAWKNNNPFLKHP